MNIWIFWVIIIVAVISLLIVGLLVRFGFILYRMKVFQDRLLEDILHRWVHNRPSDLNIVSNAFEEYLSRRNEFWTLYGQFIISIFVVVCITILLLTKTISAEAGLPILSGVGGFAIGKGITVGKGVTYRRPE